MKLETHWKSNQLEGHPNDLLDEFIDRARKEIAEAEKEIARALEFKRDANSFDDSGRCKNCVYNGHVVYKDPATGINIIRCTYWDYFTPYPFNFPETKGCNAFKQKEVKTA
jgi:hypothetical protein